MIDPENLRKELKKWEEHQRGPMDFVKEHRDSIKALPLYGKPSIDDMYALEVILNRAFVGLSAAL